MLNEHFLGYLGQLLWDVRTVLSHGKGKKMGEGRACLRPPPLVKLSCCRCLIYQIDDGLIGEATVHREADLASAAVAVALSRSLQVGLQVVKARSVQLRIEETAIARPSTTVDTGGRDNLFRTELSQCDQLLFHTHLGGTTGGMNRHRNGQFMEMQPLSQVVVDELHRLVEAQALV